MSKKNKKTNIKKGEFKAYFAPRDSSNLLNSVTNENGNSIVVNESNSFNIGDSSSSTSVGGSGQDE